MCIECNERLTRRAFLTSATATLAVEWGERAPMPVSPQHRDEWVSHVTSYTFVKLQMQDLQAGIDHLYAQSFIKRKGAAVIGFCGGGRLALLFSIQSKAIKAIVS